MRVGLSQRGQTSITLLSGSGCAMSRMPPCWICGTRSFWLWLGRGFVWRLAMLMPLITTAACDSVGRVRGGSLVRGRTWCRGGA